MLFGIAKATKDLKMSAALMDKAADLKSKVDEQGAPLDLAPPAPDIEPPPRRNVRPPGRRPLNIVVMAHFIDDHRAHFGFVRRPSPI